MQEWFRGAWALPLAGDRGARGDRGAGMVGRDVACGPC